MTRDAGWRFLSLGRRIERLQFQCEALDQAVSGAAPGQEAELDWLLEISDSTITYRSRYMARPEWMPLLDDSNSRSIAFQLKGLNDYLHRLGTALGPCGAELTAPWVAELGGFDPDSDLHPGSARLQNLLRGMHAMSIALSDELGLRFFSHSLNRQTFAT